MSSFSLQNKMDVQEEGRFFENEGFITDKNKMKRKTSDINPEHFHVTCDHHTLAQRTIVP